MNTITLHLSRLAIFAVIALVSAVLYLARSPEPPNVKVSWIYRFVFLAAMIALCLSAPLF